MNKIKCVIFDLDGTLINSMVDVLNCFNNALLKYNMPTKEIIEFIDCVGGDLEQVVTKLLPNKEKQNTDLIDKIKKEYVKVYSQCDMANTKPYKGMIEIVDFLHKQNVYCCVNSNKNEMLSKRCVYIAFPDFVFDRVIGSGMNIKSKPDPEGVYEIAKEFNLDINNIVYVGDTKTDVLTAKNANVKCIYVKWGQGKSTDLTLYDNIVVIDNDAQLLNYLKENI